MKYFQREITKREVINRFGRLGYVLYTEYVKTNDINKFNKGLKIKFFESDKAKKYLLHKNINTVYEEPGEIVSHHASKYKR